MQGYKLINFETFSWGCTFRSCCYGDCSDMRSGCYGELCNEQKCLRWDKLGSTEKETREIIEATIAKNKN